MRYLTDKSLEEAIRETNSKPLSVAPTHIVWRQSDLDDPRNVVKFLRAKRDMREAIYARSRKTWADRTLNDWHRQQWTPVSAIK